MEEVVDIAGSLILTGEHGRELRPKAQSGMVDQWTSMSD